MENETLNISIQRTGQTLVGGHQNHGFLTGLGRVLDEERMVIVDASLGQVRNDVADLVGVRAGLTHPVLCLAHLRGRNHLHRLGDLARILYALDLSANFLCTRHLVLSECFLCALTKHRSS